MRRVEEEPVRTERRRSPRLPMKLNVTFSTLGQDRELEGSGFTENVSAGGLYFRSGDGQLLAEGRTLALTVSGLSHYDNGPFLRLLKGQATVLRLESPAPHAIPGVAVRFSKPLQMDCGPLAV